MASAPSTPKAGWEVKTLGEACEMYQPKTISKKEMDPNGEYPVFGANGIIGRYNKYNHEDTELLIGCRGSCGLVTISEPFAWINGNAMVMRPHEESLNRDFLRYNLLDSKLLEDAITGTAIPQITRKSLNPISIPIPPLAEQERIVGILDEAFEGIAAATAQAEKNLHNARELFQSVLQSTFSQKGDDWKDRPIGELCDILNGFAFKSKDAIESSNVQVIRMGNLYQNELNLNRKPAFYPESFPNEYEMFLLSEGDIIMSLTGTVGKEDYGFAVQIPQADRSLLLNQRIAKFHSFNESLNDSYFLHYLKSRVFLDVLYSTSRGTRQANLSSATIKNLTVPTPPLATQQAIVEKLDALSGETKRLEAIYERKQAALTELKQSLLEKAFAGEL